MFPAACVPTQCPAFLFGCTAHSTWDSLSQRVPATPSSSRSPATLLHQPLPDPCFTLRGPPAWLDLHSLNNRCLSYTSAWNCESPENEISMVMVAFHCLVEKYLQHRNRGWVFTIKQNPFNHMAVFRTEFHLVRVWPLPFGKNIIWFKFKWSNINRYDLL